MVRRETFSLTFISMSLSEVDEGASNRHMWSCSTSAMRTKDQCRGDRRGQGQVCYGSIRSLKAQMISIHAMSDGQLKTVQCWAISTNKVYEGSGISFKSYRFLVILLYRWISYLSHFFKNLIVVLLEV